MSVHTELLRREGRALLIIVMLNLKGGSTKTTSAAWILHVLHEAGLSVLGVDTDPENESLISWSELGEWPFPVISMPVANLHKQLPGVIKPDVDVVVIDTPPMKEQRRIVKSAAKLATHIVVTMAPTSMEYERLPAVLELFAEVCDEVDPPELVALLTRTVTNAASTDTYRELITGNGVRVLRATVPRRELFAQGYGTSITNAQATPYAAAVDELLNSVDTEIDEVSA
ncbi:ParA family protein [Nocardia abscessus]|uniref:ParA family protein n=1 Tax=Nocardia abscessus TaxID=120957 RepID=UPI001E3F4449|nr:ParA family protein [Nocardia abscessus]